MADKEREKYTLKSLQELYLKLEMSKIPSDVIVSRSEEIVTFLPYVTKDEQTPATD